jgi:hypothetical protein
VHKDWYVAIVPAGTAFDAAAHRRLDIDPIKIAISEAESNGRARVVLTCARGAMADVADLGGWLHLSRELSDGSLKHMAYGYLLDIPLKTGSGDTEQLEFNCSPVNWTSAENTAVQPYRVVAHADPVLISPERRGDTAEILDGYAKVTHCHRATHTYSVVDIFGTSLPDFSISDPFMPGPERRMTGTPLAAVDVTLETQWTQSGEGSFDATSLIVDQFRDKGEKINTLTGEHLENNWPKPGAGLNGNSGWFVLKSTLTDVTETLVEADFPRRAGPFHGSSKVFNYLDDPNLTSPVPKDVSLPRSWYDAEMVLGWVARQKRRETVTLRLINGCQLAGIGEVKRLTLSCADVTQDDGTAQWATDTTYASGAVVRFGQGYYQATSAHTSGGSFQRDWYNGRWQAVTVNASPIGDRMAETYFRTSRGLQTIFSAIFKARSLIAHSTRCVEVKVRCELTDDLLDITTAATASLSAPHDMLPGGFVKAKVSNVVMLSEQADEYLEVTVLAAVGSGPDSSSGISETGEAWDQIAVELDGASPLPFGDIGGVCFVENGGADQIDYIAANDFDTAAGRTDKDATNPTKLVRDVPTKVTLIMTPMSGRPEFQHFVTVATSPWRGPLQYDMGAE